MKCSTQQVATGFGHYVRELQALGLKRSEATRLSHLITRWTKSRGPNGCLDYLDALGETLKSYLYNLPKPQTKVWIKTDHEGFPSVLTFIKGKHSRRTIKKIGASKRLIRLVGMTKSQVKKFTDAVLGPVVQQSVIDGMLTEFILPGARHFRRTSKEKYISIGSHLGLYPIKAIGKSKRKKSHSLLAARQFFGDLLHLEPLWENRYVKEFFDRTIKTYTTQTWVPTSIADFVDMTRSACSAVDGVVGDDKVGVLGTTQEPGGKLRCFASPRTIYQVMFVPLFDYLMDLLAQLPEDCTKDQDKGANFAFERIQKGLMTHSIDLSNATDRFPYALQRRVLQFFNIPEGLLEVLDFAVKGTWKCPKELGSEISWSQGQPLGLLPSFSMFALTHHFLIRGIYLKLGLSEFDYRLLGDDVLIGNTRVAEIYKNLMEQMSVSISQQKSYSSCNYAEFAGYQISEELFRPGKFREPTPQNIVAKLKDAKNPYAYLPKRLISAEMIQEAFPYGLQVPSDEVLKKYPLETLKALYNALKVGPKEYLLSREIASMMSHFHLWKAQDWSTQYTNLTSRYRLYPQIDVMLEPLYSGPENLARATINGVIQALLFCEDNIVEDIIARIRQDDPEFRYNGRFQACRYIAQTYPEFTFGSQEYDRRLNLLARFHEMEFSITQLSRLLAKVG
jgi:hypothetical protein